MFFLIVPISMLLIVLLMLTTLAQAMGHRYHTAVMCGMGVLGWIGVLYFSLSKLSGQ